MMAPVIHDDDDAVLMPVIMDAVRISGADRCWCVISFAQNESSLGREVADSFMSSLGPQLRVEKMHFSDYTSLIWPGGPRGVRQSHFFTP